MIGGLVRSRTRDPRKWIAPASFSAVWLIVCLTTATYGSLYTSQQLGLILIYGLLALSFTFAWGLGGIFSLCQTALFGIGAYAYGALTINMLEVPGAGFLGLLVGTVAAVVAAVALGWFLFYGRLSGMYVAVATLAFDLILLTFMNGTAGPQYHIGAARFGGQNGMVGITPLGLLPADSSAGFSFTEFLIFVCFLNLFATLAIRYCTRMPWFRVVLAVKENELRARTLGFDSRSYRLLLFTVAAALAGLAGAEYAAQQLYISTNVFSLSTAALVIIWVLLGGKASITGAYLGTAIMQLLTLALASLSTDIEVFVSGFIMIAAVTFLPDGVASVGKVLTGLWRNRRRNAMPESQNRETSQSDETGTPRVGAFESIYTELREPVSLAVTGVSKSFGGAHAVRGLTLTFEPRTLTCIVGPNGAGKSTLFHLISGRYRQDGGDILYGSAPLDANSLESRVSLGVAVKYQAPQLFPELSVREHLYLAAYAQQKIWFEAQVRAENLASIFGLVSVLDNVARELAHGDSQRLDIAMALASQPSLLLLDEPTAGLNPEEIDQLEKLLKSLDGRISIIVITHDFAFVDKLASPVVVMSEGGIFKTGSVNELKNDKAFINLYLGRTATAAETK